MEYDFIHDTITGNAIAKFSSDHEVIGPWLEVEIGRNAKALEETLIAIDNVSSGAKKEQVIVGTEYTLNIGKNDASIETNASLNGESTLPEALQSDDLDFDMLNSASCGLEDFRAMLTSWARFIRS